MRQRVLFFAVVVAFSSTLVGNSAASDAARDPTATAKKCKQGFVHRVKRGKHICVRKRRPPQPADVSVTVADSPDPVTVGSSLTYVITLVNNGPGPAKTVGLADTLPDDVTLVSVTATRGPCSTSPPEVECLYDTLPSGSNVTVTIVVRPMAPGLLTNTVGVATVSRDPDESNNFLELTTQVNAAAPPAPPAS